MKTAILMMAHGSRIEEANSTALSIAEMVREISGYEIVEVAFRELHKPDIQQGIDNCVNLGAERILMIPYFLFMGAHVLNDLPEEIEIARKRHPGLVMEMGRHLGVHRKLAEIVVERIDQSLREKGWE